MTDKQKTTVLISGYFNPLHGGHLNLIEGAKALGDKLVVIVNNDKQQMMKKGKIILDEQNRLRLINALRDVDEAWLSVDQDGTQIESLRLAANKYSGDKLIFANGGDRNSGEEIPETATCEELNIELEFEVGDSEKFDSSTRINQATGNEK